ncbi:SusD/RagB family nutrient-binding outer membrane lipoprotein [Sphingobacterium sp. SYP-B4668]|uniref:SusD/RagB family nutrient-binding outer membrane lipoprotein n=1 Tax=Sphingobacterium sp. SYP-B4668 TaxID=2996035 RepID=UPI0022DD9D38|nr:SusD/RagB family nutrient-binding outer membrane lipoprotein [Sphingobacterium sp. SYP-B4668]
MKNIYTIIFVACIVSMGQSCKSGFEEINTNPNLINQISPGTLLNETLYNMSSNNIRNSYDINSELMQVQLTYPQYYGGVQRYEILENTGLSQWNASYKWAKNVQEMLAAAERDNASNYRAIALTLRAWIYSNLVDNFGDVPFTEASRADEGILQAAYDDQKVIYTQLLEDLELANGLYDHKVAMAYGTDLLFGNNSKLWQKFTNSLYLRLLLRTSNVDASAYKKMQTMVNDPVKYPIVEKQEESVIFRVTGVAPNVSPWSRALDFSTQHAVGAYFIDILNTLNDPRRPIYVTAAKEQGQDIGYKGIPSGYDEQSFPYSPSYMNNAQVVVPMIIPILTYSEVCFIKAELGQRGYLPEPEKAYKAGIIAAVSTWTNAALPVDYFEQPLVIYDGSLERIILHKYLALYFTDYQQWSEYRRTGYPILPTTSSMLNSGKMPARLMYPGIQKVYNPTNYKQAIDRMGEDDINHKLWWAKK